MSIFGKIKDAIFGRDKAEQPATGSATRTAPDPTVPGMGNAWADTSLAEQEPAPVIDVTNHLDSMPGADRLNWRTSIVDLMKLIGVDSDYDSRKALATEMGRADYSGSAEDNVWLHQRVMRELAANGGKVPAEFVD